jgi:hypothetical protein
MLKEFHTVLLKINKKLKLKVGFLNLKEFNLMMKKIIIIIISKILNKIK